MSAKKQKTNILYSQLVPFSVIKTIDLNDYITFFVFGQGFLNKKSRPV